MKQKVIYLDDYRGADKNNISPFAFWFAYFHSHLVTFLCLSGIASLWIFVGEGKVYLIAISSLLALWTILNIQKTITIFHRKKLNHLTAKEEEYICMVLCSLPVIFLIVGLIFLFAGIPQTIKHTGLLLTFYGLPASTIMWKSFIFVDSSKKISFNYKQS